MKLITNFTPVCKIFAGIGSTLFVAFLGNNVFGQTSGTATLRIPSPAVWFLTLAPDARAGGMGDAGVASSPDANSTYWNASKLAFAERDFGASASYTKWLPALTNDLWIGYASAYKKLGDKQAVAVSVNYFDKDYIYLPFVVNPQRALTTTQYAINGTYARQLGENFSMGLTLKYISSAINGQQVINGQPVKNGKTVAADLSAYYRKKANEKITWSLGAAVSNFGGKISYGLAGDENFIPTMLKIGGGLSYKLNDSHQFNFSADLSKLMVPTPDTARMVTVKPAIEGILGSFNDAPGGFKEELQEIALSAGAEYWYKNTLALRGGFYGENKNKGGRQYFTAGAGLRVFKNYQADFSYIFPVIENSPLAKTFRISVSTYLGRNRELASL